MDDLPRVDERPPESVDFAPVRVGPRRRRIPGVAVAAGWIVAFVAIVAVAGLGGSSPRPQSPVALGDLPAPTGRSDWPRSYPVRPGPGLPERTNDPTLIALAADVEGERLSLAGDVFASSVVWVFISLQDERGQVRTWTSLSSADNDGGGIRPDHWPSFRVELPLEAVPDAVRAGGPLWAEVNAYNAIGRKIASVRQLVLPVERSQPRVPVGNVRA